MIHGVELQGRMRVVVQMTLFLYYLWAHVITLITCAMCGIIYQNWALCP